MTDAELLDGLDEELGGSSPQERDWRGMATAIIVILAICSLIAGAVFLFTPFSGNAPKLPVPTPYSVVNYWHRKEQWIDEQHIQYFYKNEMWTLDVTNNQTTPSKPMASNFGDASGDGRYYVASETNNNPSRNPEWITKTYQIVELGGKKSRRDVVGAGGGRNLQTFAWDPKGHAYAFVQDGQLYFRETPETGGEPMRISDGEKTKWNGLHDWVYTEEIHDRSKGAIWWAPSGKAIAYPVHEPNLTIPINLAAYNPGDKYPLNSDVHYPKTNADRANMPVYELAIWDRNTNQARIMDIQTVKSSEYRYLFAQNWVTLHGQERLVATWANRWQNETSVTLCDFQRSRCTLIYEHQYPKMWAMPSDYQTMRHTDDSLFVILPNMGPNGNYYNHVVRLHVPAGDGKATPEPLPAGNFDVADLLRIDASNGLFYFTANAPEPSDLHLFVTSLTAQGQPAANCVTCGIPDCTYQQHELSPELKQVLIKCRGPGQQRNVRAWINAGVMRQETLPLPPPTNYTEFMSTHAQPIIRFEEVQLANGFSALCKIILPYEPQRNARPLPVMLYVYSGPGWHAVDKSSTWQPHHWWALNQSMAIVMIDARGSAARGWNYRSAIYGHLGDIEMDDQAEAMVKLVGTHSHWFDKNRVMVYGWSYGGYATLSIVERAPVGFYRCAMSVAPVTNFLYYDATYTERYMGAVKDSDYDKGDVSLGDINKFRHTNLLLVHGLYDDNVHFQHSALFIEKLQIAGIKFDLMVYPNQAHSIIDRRLHLDKLQLNFIMSCNA
ncbi:unnamed protein product, partial [Mesorhabditis spiculigera]